MVRGGGRGVRPRPAELALSEGAKNALVHQGHRGKSRSPVLRVPIPPVVAIPSGVLDAVAVEPTTSAGRGR